MARRRRGDLGQVRQRRHVARLVEAQQQWQFEPAAGERRALVRAVDDLREQREEDRPQQLRRLGVADQVQRRALVEQPVGRDLARPPPSARRVRTGRRAAAPGRSPRSRSGCGRPACLERAHRVVGGVRAAELGLVRAAPPQRRKRLMRARACPGRRPSGRRCRSAPRSPRRRTAAARDAAPRRSPRSHRPRRRAGQAAPAAASRHATSSAPSHVFADAQRRPRLRRGAGQRERVEDEHVSDRAPALERHRHQVGLDRGGDRRAVPLQQRRDREACRFTRLRRPEGDEGVALPRRAGGGHGSARGRAARRGLPVRRRRVGPIRGAGPADR